jgi:glycosyltransferase involved in cell wall biosynthesis
VIRFSTQPQKIPEGMFMNNKKPLIEARVHEVPVIIYASSAVPETMGQAGMLVYDWDSAQVAELMQLVIWDKTLKEQLLAKQRSNLDRFSVSEAAKRLQAAVQYLQNGQKNVLLTPNRTHL